jgi:hypothetical protein
MKCFHCKKEIENESLMEHVGDGDFVHTKCSEEFKKNREEFFENVGNDKWYNNWLEQY